MKPWNTPEQLEDHARRIIDAGWIKHHVEDIRELTSSTIIADEVNIICNFIGKRVESILEQYYIDMQNQNIHEEHVRGFALNIMMLGTSLKESDLYDCEP